MLDPKNRYLTLMVKIYQLIERSHSAPEFFKVRYKLVQKHVGPYPHPRMRCCGFKKVRWCGLSYAVAGAGVGAVEKMYYGVGAGAGAVKINFLGCGCGCGCGLYYASFCPFLSLQCF